MVRSISLLVMLCSFARCAAPHAVASAEPPSATSSVEPVDVRCGARIDGGERRSVRLGTRAATQEGARLTFDEPEEDGRLVLGVLGPINEDSPANLDALRRYLAFFDEAKADAILVTGDVAEAPERIARVLSELARGGLPVLVVLGNTESRGDFAEGVQEAQRSYPNIVDLTRIRTVQFRQLALVSLPGYHDAAFVRTKTSCLYSPDMVAEIVQEAKRRTTPVALVAHGPPRGQGVEGLDWARTVNAGDAALATAIASAGIRYGFFSNIKEAGGRASAEPSGLRPLGEAMPSPTLFLNPGPADTTPWELNDGRRSYGMAALFALEGGQASFRLLRLPPQERKASGP